LVITGLQELECNVPIPDKYQFDGKFLCRFRNELNQAERFRRGSCGLRERHFSAVPAEFVTILLGKNT
jgi:hypothetical protein